MALSYTANYGLKKAADGDTSWGTPIRWNADKIDELLKTNEDNIANNVTAIQTNTASMATLATKVTNLETAVSDLQAATIECTRLTHRDNGDIPDASGSADDGVIFAMKSIGGGNPAYLYIFLDGSWYRTELTKV